MATRSDNTPWRILVVDDVAVNVSLLAGFLRPQGYIVDTAQSGEQAIEVMSRELPDLVLLDAVMPGIDGFELLKRLRSEEATQHIPVIMVTALTAIEDKIRGQEAGADDFVTKPFDRTELLLRVKSMLRIKSLHDQLSQKVSELEEAKARLRELAEHDGLTALYNKRYFTQAAHLELERARRTGRKFSLILIDIDHFKRCNDTHGHPTGDHVLRQFAEILQQQSRKIDVVARYGGEEFVHLLVESPLDGAIGVAEKHRAAIESNAFVDERGRPLGKQTASLGVASYPADGLTVEDVIKAADERLYKAKQEGRNRVCAEKRTRKVPVGA